MVTEFELLDTTGKVLGQGEIDNDIYRLFSPEYPEGYKEFENLKEMLAKCGGVAIQPLMFETHARTRQLSLLGGKASEGNKTADQ